MDREKMDNLLFRMRALLTNINGFGELLADPLVARKASTRLHYAEIILASGQRLEDCFAELARLESVASVPVPAGEGSAAHHMELARLVGVESRNVYLHASAMTVSVSFDDTGPTAKLFWGRDDYERKTSVLAADYPALIFALLREKYDGRLEAQREFASFCDQHGIPSELFYWSTD